MIAAMKSPSRVRRSWLGPSWMMSQWTAGAAAHAAYSGRRLSGSQPAAGFSGGRAPGSRIFAPFRSSNSASGQHPSPVRTLTMQQLREGEGGCDIIILGHLKIWHPRGRSRSRPPSCGRHKQLVRNACFSSSKYGAAHDAHSSRLNSLRSSIADWLAFRCQRSHVTIPSRSALPRGASCASHCGDACSRVCKGHA
jgi:hypothetical protein